MLVPSPKNLSTEKILQHDISLAFLQQLLGECHIRPERIEGWRTWCGTGGNQAIFGLFDVALAQSDSTQDEVAVMDAVAEAVPRWVILNMTFAYSRAFSI